MAEVSIPVPLLPSPAAEARVSSELNWDCADEAVCRNVCWAFSDAVFSPVMLIVVSPALAARSFMLVLILPLESFRVAALLDIDPYSPIACVANDWNDEIPPVTVENQLQYAWVSCGDLRFLLLGGEGDRVDRPGKQAALHRHLLVAGDQVLHLLRVSNTTLTTQKLKNLITSRYNRYQCKATLTNAINTITFTTQQQ